MSIEPIQLLIFAFNDEQQANQALKVLKEASGSGTLTVDDAAIITRDTAGKTHFHETQDISPRGGAIFGALAGAVVGLLGGPVGAALGALAGAATGGVAAKRIDMGFPEETLKEIAASLTPGSSAVIALVQYEWVEAVTGKMTALEAKVIQQTLKADVVTAAEEGALESEEELYADFVFRFIRKEVESSW